MENVSAALWGFYTAAVANKTTETELGCFYYFLNDLWTQEVFVFYLKARRLVYQIKFGDNGADRLGLHEFTLTTQEWVNIASKAFSDCCRPTSFVQIISSRLLELEYTLVPAEVFIYYCIQEYKEVKKKTAHTSQMFISTPKVTKPPRKVFDLMAFGRAQSPRFDAKTPPKPVQRPPKPQENRQPLVLKNTQGTLTAETGESMDRLIEQVASLKAERDQLKDTLEETVEFCDTVSQQHDLLLDQYTKIKHLACTLTERLMAIDEESLREFDFSVVLEDPCAKFTPVGTIHGSDSYASLKQPEEIMPLHEPSLLAFEDELDRAIPAEHAEPSELAELTELTGPTEDGYIVSHLNYIPKETGLLEIRKGNRVKRLSELDEWIFGENVDTGIRGFYPNTLFS